MVIKVFSFLLKKILVAQEHYIHERCVSPVTETAKREIERGVLTVRL
jgi:hypothetical protein